jgi:DNA-binding CsgD family transcriptional regulator
MARLDSLTIEKMFGAVDNPSRWVELMDHLRSTLRVECVAAQFLVASRDDLLPIWATRDSVSQSRAALHDSWANSQANPRFRRPSLPMPDLEIDSDQRSNDFTAAERVELREGLARCGLGPAFWISQQIDAEHHFTLIFHRAADDGRDMQADEVAWLTTIAPHFRQAVRLWARLAAADAQAALINQATDAIATGLVACDRRLRVQWMNSDATRLLVPGAAMHVRDGTLVCARRDDRQRLQTLIADRPDRAVLALADDRGDRLHVRLRRAGPVPGQMALFDDRVLLAISSPDRAQRPDPDDIARLFALTATEAALAAELAAGGSVSEFALARGVAEGTARLHLKRILAKTGTSRQADLVRRICRSVGGIGT